MVTRGLQEGRKRDRDFLISNGRKKSLLFGGIVGRCNLLAFIFFTKFARRTKCIVEIPTLKAWPPHPRPREKVRLGL
jgi:hypothetical protein